MICIDHPVLGAAQHVVTASGLRSMLGVMEGWGLGMDVVENNVNWWRLCTTTGSIYDSHMFLAGSLRALRLCELRSAGLVKPPVPPKY